MFGKNYDGYERLEVEEQSQKLPGSPNKMYLTMFVIIVAALLTFLYNNFFISSMLNDEQSPSDLTTTTDLTPTDDQRYLVSSPKCKMIDLDPFNEEALRFYAPISYKPCTKLELLTYVTKGENFSTVHIREELMPLYSQNGIRCCYHKVSRSLDTDSGALFSACTLFRDNITITSDAVMIRCVDSNSTKSVYENVHIAVTPTEAVLEKMENFDRSEKPLSVLLIGIDSVSRLNLIRSMPETYKFLEENDDWVPLEGYNKVADNTFPNLIAILTGFDQSYAYKVCNPHNTSGLNNCPMVWYDYRERGYITAYAEDEAEINTFNYLKKGFSTAPTDYYFRPYFMAAENLIGVTKGSYCTGPETSGERVMNVAKDFATTFKPYPTFGFFWMNSFSHDYVNSPSGMDHKVKTFLENLHREEINRDTIIILISDHGMRFGDIRLTLTGWLEERLPFIYVSFPKWFQNKFPTEFNNFKSNIDKLTCPYDLYMTLQHIISLTDPNYQMAQSQACPLCHSLFDQINPDRSCRDAGISQHWCACTGYKETKLDTELETNALNFILDEVRNTIRSYDGENSCRNYTVSKVISTRVSQPLAHDHTTYLYFLFETEPKADFEATVYHNGERFKLTGDVSRLDSYAKNSQCVSNANLQKYCYCY